jgi:hypothetical protein
MFFYEAVPGDRFLEEQPRLISLGEMVKDAGAAVASFGTAAVRFGSSIAVALTLTFTPMGQGVASFPGSVVGAAGPREAAQRVDDEQEFMPDRVYPMDQNGEGMVAYLMAAPRVDSLDHLTFEELD